MQKIYVVEDDENIRELVIYALGAAGFETVGFETGTDFFAALKTTLPAIILLDIMLPEEDGLTILKRLRNNMNTKKLPIIMLTAKSSEHDRVKGLDRGADDYISKPFSVLELISRVNAVLRRSQPEEQSEHLAFGILSLDDARREVSVSGEKVTLTYKEYELLRCLLMNAGFVLSRDKILDNVWGYDFEGESRTVDMHIKTLRHKLGEAGKHIKTVRNIGYKLELEQ